MPNANILIDGAGTSRSLTVLPVMNQSGTTLITLSVTDGATSASTSFSLTVNPMNDAPTMDWEPPVFLGYNPGQQTVGLSGITSGAENESQTLALSVANSRASFYFTEPSISYTNPNTTAVVTFRPKNATGVGSNVVTVTINDGGAINNILTQSFLIYCRPNNTVAPPIASGIANQTTPEDTRVGPINFTVRSAVVPANLLRLSGYSSNQKLLPNGNITFGGSGTNRNVTLLPATNEIGTARVTISVTDTNYGGTNISFNLTVNAAGDAPVVSGLANISVAEDTSSGLLPFTVRDPETPAGALTLSAFSANTTLIPNANIVLGGNGGGPRSDANTRERTRPGPQRCRWWPAMAR